METETTTIRIDKETKKRLEDLAGGYPLARYLRGLSRSEPGGFSIIKKHLEAIENILLQRTEPLAGNLAELIIEARQLGQNLGYSERRMRTLDIFLAKSKPETVSFIVNDLKDKLLHPEKTPVDRAIEDIARQSGQDAAEVRALMEKMSKLSPEQRAALCKAVMENPNLQQISFEVKENES